MDSEKFSHNFAIKHILEDWNFPYSLVIIHMGGLIEERYFHFNGIDDKDKLEAAAVCLEGRAMVGEKNVDCHRGCVSSIHTPIIYSITGNLYEVLIELQQTRNVAHYREDFELISASLKDADDAVSMGIFHKWT